MVLILVIHFFSKSRKRPDRFGAEESLRDIGSIDRRGTVGDHQENRQGVQLRWSAAIDQTTNAIL